MKVKADPIQVKMTALDEGGGENGRLRKNRNQALLIGMSLAILVLISYRGVTGNDFVNYDDPAYVTENRHVERGLSIEGLSWAFTAAYANNWHPLTWVSLMLDREAFWDERGRVSLDECYLASGKRPVAVCHTGTHDGAVMV